MAHVLASVRLHWFGSPKLTHFRKNSLVRVCVCVEMVNRKQREHVPCIQVQTTEISAQNSSMTHIFIEYETFLNKCQAHNKRARVRQ